MIMVTIMTEDDETQFIHCASVNVRFDGNSNKPVPIPPSGSIPRGRGSWWDRIYAERPWAERRSRLVDALLATGPLDIVGFQEVYHNQLLDLAALLGPTYGYIGVGRDDGKEAGEYSPIYFNKDRFKLAQWKTIWLSLTPEVPGSKSWDANLTRIATFCTLSWIIGPQCGQLVHVVNTHYDDAGEVARAESSLLIRQHITRWIKRFEDPLDPTYAPPAPVILIGDFNSPPDEDGYKNITSHQPLPCGLPSITFLDSYTNLSVRRNKPPDPDPDSDSDSDCVNSATIPSIPFSSSRSFGSSRSSRRTPNLTLQSTPYGPAHTYTGFTAPGKTPTTRIDFIMLASAHTPSDHSEDPPSRNPDEGDGDGDEDESQLGQVGRGDWWVWRYACIDNWIEGGDVDKWQGRWSDHRMVRVTFRRD